MGTFSRIHIFCNRLVGATLACGAFLLPVHAAVAQEIEDKPVCDLSLLMIGVWKYDGYFPSGIKASSDIWEMEIYINRKTDRWILAGVGKESRIAPSDEICLLAYGDAPYARTNWYAEHFTGTDADQAHNVISVLVAAANSKKESKKLFLQRVGETFRRVADTELMVLEVFGSAWRTMSPSQRAEATQLYADYVLISLHGVISLDSGHDEALPAQFALTGGRLREVKGGLMKLRCDFLRMAHCVSYTAKAKANDTAIEYDLLKLEGGWRVVDIVWGVASFQEGYRPQIQALLKHHGVPHTLDAIRKRVQE